ncbi:MAG: DUF1501 domain-containing protein [Planctomycetota bacterium]|nr:DUF1501 domain-containing protein [Planctomycetota bacterium]
MRARSDNFEGTPGQAAVPDQAMSALLADLQAKGLLDQTHVVLGIECGPTLRINDNDGRNHHNRVFTCMLAGAVIRGEEAARTSTATTLRGRHGRLRSCTRR